MQNKGRLYYIDNLKAFLIILVVVGHCIQNFLPGYESNPLYNFIYSFHMPLFIFVSGYVSYKEHITWNSVGKRFKQLMIPFFAWAAVKTLIMRDINVFPYIMIHPDNGLWFLHTLFFVSLIMMICEAIAEKMHIRRYIVVIVVGFVLLGIRYVLGFTEYGFQSIVYYFMFYVTGFYARRTGIFCHIPSSVAIVLSLVIVAIAPFYNVRGLASFMHAGTPTIVNTAFRFLVAVIAITGIFTLFTRFAYDSNRIGSYLGTRTLGIYAIHPSLLGLYVVCFGKVSYVTSEYAKGIVCVSVICVLAITLVVYELFSKNKYISYLFLGK